MKMPTIRRIWTFYKRVVLREVDVTRRDEVQVLAQNAFYLGAQCALQALATLLEDDDVEQVQEVIERHGQQLKWMRTRGAGASTLIDHRNRNGYEVLSKAPGVVIDQRSTSALMADPASIASASVEPRVNR